MIELEELGWGPGMKPSQRLKFAQLARPGRPSALAPYGSKYSPKKFTQPSLWACLWVKEYLRQDYRGLEDLWASSAERRAAWGWCSTFHGFMRHRVTPTLRKAARATTLRLFRRRSRRGETGFSRRPASHYSMRRMGRRQRARRFRMLSMVVGVRPQAICAQGVRVGPGSPSRLLPPLVQETVRHGAVRRRLASADSDSEPTHRWLREEPGIESIIPATGCRPGRARTPYRRRRPRYFPRRKYGRRWIAETVASVLQRKFGEALTTRRKQALLRGLVYNLRRAVAVLWVHRLFPVGRRHPHSPEVFDGATLTDLDHAKFHPLERSRGDGGPEPLRSKAGS